MHSQYRDGLLAIGGLLGLAGVSAVTVGVGRLFDPIGVGTGVAAALAIEAVFLRYPSRMLRLWERRGVPVLGLCAVLAAGGLAVRVAPWLVAVPVWGLITYLGLLGCVLLGVGNPVSVLVVLLD